VATATLARVSADSWPDPLSIAAGVLIVGAPLSAPWLVFLLMNLRVPLRSLGVIESVFYVALLVNEGTLFFRLPGLESRSEGFVSLYLVWISFPVTMVACLLTLGAKKAK
jgi:hypothetical protein